VATLAASAGLMPLFSRHRVLGAGLLAVLAAVSPTGPPGSTLAPIQVAWRERVTPVAALAAVGGGAHLLRRSWRAFSGLAFSWWVVVAFAVYAALLGWGAQARARQRLIGSLAERARLVEADQAQRVAEARAAERHEIAREMHDVLAHRL